ncbi:hypothetical protein C349_06584 [Cryptococcus neoformans var. grubii Br795]|nr:hypothetical protein C349_06584 [Cryptococcus neoformans var. grubii Br795]OXH03017.1 hypothetical protein C370_06676 [Cryptococcus neoformans var. grubii A1-35-8]
MQEAVGRSKDSDRKWIV